MVYFFTANCYCIAWIKCLWQCTKPQPSIFYPKLSDLVLLDTTSSLVCAKRRICNERKEQGPIFLCTNENAQLLYSPQAEWTNWPRPTRRNQTSIRQLEAADWLVKLPLSAASSCLQPV